MNRIALGTAQFGLNYGIANRGGQVGSAEVAAMLALVRSHGVDTLDTAIAYGDSERALGQAGTAGLRVVTKLPALPDQCADVGAWVQEQIDASLLRMGLEQVYGVLLHRPDQLLGEQGGALYQALQSLKDSGRAGKIGVSVYAPEQLAALMPRFRIDLVQASYNIVDRRLVRSGALAHLRQAGVEVHTRSAFLQGLLLLAPDAIPPAFAPFAPLFARWHAWLAQQDMTALQACLAFVLAEGGIDRVVTGADNAAQIGEIMGAGAPFSGAWPDLECDDEALINPSQWNVK